MYVGRIVALGKTVAGKNCLMYRVSARSFPSWQAVQTEKGIAIIPRQGHEADLEKSPYIAYNCLRITGQVAVASNGTQADPIVEKIASGMSIRDAAPFEDPSNSPWGISKLTADRKRGLK